MRHHVKRLTSCAMVLVALGLAGWADVIILDDGRKIEGLVLSESPVDVSVKLDTGAVVNFPRQRVRSIAKADWQYYINKGDTAATGAEALLFYETAKKMNPTAPGLDDKIKSAKLRAEAEAKQKTSGEERARRQAEEAEIVGRYQKLMDGARYDAARESLEQAIAEKPWVCRPRILLADFYARERTPEKRASYAVTLAGLIRNDPASYYGTYAAPLVDAAKRALLDSSAGVLSFDLKDRLISCAAPFTDENGKIRAFSDYERRRIEKATSAPLALAKIEFLKNVCLDRAGEGAGIELEVTTFLAYANQLSAAERQSMLRPQLDRWAKQAQEFVDRNDAGKGAILADVVLTFDPQNGVGRAAAAKSRAQEARRFRERTLFDKARKSIEAAEKVVPNDPQITAEKARLFAAIAQSQANSGNFEEAIGAIATAVAARSSDAEATKMVRAEQNRLHQVLLTRAKSQAERNNPAGAIDSTELALKAKSDVLTQLKAQSQIADYRKQLRAIAVQQTKDTAERQTFADLVSVMASAKKYGAWDNQMTSDVLKAIRATKRTAQDAAAKGDAVGVFMAAGRLQPLLSSAADPTMQMFLDPKMLALLDTKTKELMKTARDTVVGGGQLTVQNFFAGAWAGPEIQWVLQETESHFNGQGWRADVTAIAGNARVEHVAGSEQYTIRVDRSDAQDAILVRVIDPDTLLLERYTSTPADTTKSPTVMTYNIPIRRMPPPKPASVPGGPGGAAPTSGTLASDRG